jgi:hypothetical protein
MIFVTAFTHFHGSHLQLFDLKWLLFGLGLTVKTKEDEKIARRKFLTASGLAAGAIAVGAILSGKIPDELPKVFASPSGNAREQGPDYTAYVDAQWVDTLSSTEPEIAAMKVDGNPTSLDYADVTRRNEAAFAYTIFLDGSQIKAKNGTNGHIDMASTDAYTTIQYAVNNLPYGGHIHLRPAEYNFSDQLTFNAGSHFENNSWILSGEGLNTSIRQGTSGKHAIIIQNKTPVHIRDLEIKIEAGAGDGIRSDNTGGSSEVGIYKGSISHVHLIEEGAGGSSNYLLNLINPADCTFSHITFAADLNSGLIAFMNLQNSSSGGYCGNSIFEELIMALKGCDGVHISSTNLPYVIDHCTFIALQSFDSSPTSGTTALLIDQGHSLVFVEPDLELSATAIYLRGTSGSEGGPESNTFIGGFLSGNDSNAIAIRCSQYACGNKFIHPNISLLTGAHIVVDETSSRTSTSNIYEDVYGSGETGALITQGGGIFRGVCWPYFFSNTMLSPTFAIDSTGIKTVTIPHGLIITPNTYDCQVSVVRDSAVTDWACSLLEVVSTDATNVIVNINVSSASGTGGATAKLALKVGMS